MYCQGKDLTMSPIKFNINGVLHYTNHLGLSFHLYRNQSIDMQCKINCLLSIWVKRLLRLLRLLIIQLLA